MQNLFDRLAAVPTLAKIGAVLGVVLVLCGGYYYFFYSDMMDEQQQLAQAEQKLTQEKQDYVKRKEEYLAFRNEVKALLVEQKELLRALPKADDIEQFIENIQAQVELAGLSKVTSVREPAVPVEMYLKIPIQMTLVGTYHQINHFFKNVGDLRRIVNIEDLKLTPVAQEPVPLNQPVLLHAEFTATTFQFNDKGHAAAAGATNFRAGGQ